MAERRSRTAEHNDSTRSDTQTWYQPVLFSDGLNCRSRRRNLCGISHRLNILRALSRVELLHGLRVRHRLTGLVRGGRLGRLSLRILRGYC